ncbi:hypothetical protein DK880_00004 [Candidatus Cardinium hertigii]|uniref:Uncharacterized protein n=2 Tax=Candidatus Cardinium hertigii TaxID=247481 RepID=A0A2Z3L6K1_9BACT|nr:hypothetical protein DK880_00004 [Candidatus Cardinium hertigii]
MPFRKVKLKKVVLQNKGCETGNEGSKNSVAVKLMDRVKEHFQGYTEEDNSSNEEPIRPDSE